MVGGGSGLETTQVLQLFTFASISESILGHHTYCRANALHTRNAYVSRVEHFNNSRLNITTRIPHNNTLSSKLSSLLLLWKG